MAKVSATYVNVIVDEVIIADGTIKIEGDGTAYRFASDVKVYNTKDKNDIEVELLRDIKKGDTVSLFSLCSSLFYKIC